MSGAILTLFLTMLTLGVVIRFMPAAERGRYGKKVCLIVVWAGIDLGMVSSLALTIISIQVPKSVNRQTAGLFTFPAAIVLAALFLVLIAVRSRRVRSLLPGDADDETRTTSSMDTAVNGDILVRIVGTLYTTAALFRVAPMAINQAVIMLPGDVRIYSTPVVLAFIGYVLAQVLVCFVTWVFYHLCLWSNRMWLTAFALIALLANYALMIVRTLKARRWISIPRDAWNTISWFINHGAAFTITAGLASCTVVAPIWLAPCSIPTVGANPAEGCLGRTRSHLYKSVTDTAALGYLCGALSTTVSVTYGSQEIELSVPGSFSVVDDQVSVDPADVSDSHLHCFEYMTSGGVRVYLIVIQKSGSSFDMGLDTCDICDPTDYYEKDSKATCKLCEVAMDITTISFKGGYNPAPIDYEVSNGTLTAPISALRASASVFTK